MIRVIVSDGYHQVTSLPVTLTVLPHLQVTGLTANATESTSPVSTVTLTFAQPINAASLTRSVIRLTRDGGPNLITANVSIVPVAGTAATYLIKGLAPLTSLNGQYTLSINLAQVNDPFGPGRAAHQSPGREIRPHR